MAEEEQFEIGVGNDLTFSYEKRSATMDEATRSLSERKERKRAEIGSAALSAQKKAAQRNATHSTPRSDPLFV